MSAYAESPNLSDLELLEQDYDRLPELAALRRRALRIGSEVFVRHVSTPTGIGYMYGVTVPRDWPVWRGSLEAVEEEIARLETPR